jgi:hypothetical protein
MTHHIGIVQQNYNDIIPLCVDEIKYNVLTYKMEEDLYKYKLRFMHMRFLNLLICHLISLQIHLVM